MKRKSNEKLKNIMSNKVATATRLTPISEITRMFSDESINHVPVVEGKKIIGIITKTDILGASFFDDVKDLDLDDISLNCFLDESFRVEEIMTKKVITLKEGDSVKDAAAILAQGQFHCVPIVNNDHELTGIVTSTDLAKFLYSM